jgi:hypothetical protein
LRHESFRSDADRLLAAIESQLRPEASQPPVRKPHPGMPELRLVAERKVRDLLPKEELGSAEASGVLALDGKLLVIFDNTTRIGVIDQDLSQTADNRVIHLEPATTPELAPDKYAGTGYEDIARDSGSGRLYLLVESVQRGQQQLPRVEILNADFKRNSQAFLDFPMEAANKGMEGLTFATRDGQPTLVALCEGNFCLGGAAGKQPGGGRIQLFRPGAVICDRVGTIELPTHLRFEDYSSVAMRGDQIAVLSQESSALWVGTFRPGSWEIVDHGMGYDLPRDKNGRVQYGNAEGVSWLDDDNLVVVSDRAKDDSEPLLRTKDRSVHKFALP